MIKKVTINDVARKAGVAKSTVSRTFAEGESVSEATRKRVLRVAEELGYEPNPLAKALSVSSTKIIAIVVPNTESIHISQVTRGVISTLSKAGYSVVTVDSSENFGEQTNIHKPLSNQLVDGIINCYSSAAEEIKILSSKKPVVCVGDRPEGYDADFVGVDYLQGYRMLCDYIKNQGYKHLCLVNGQEDENARRMSGLFKKAASAYGLVISDEDIFYANWTPNSGYQAMQKILKKNRPDVVVCASDMVAFGAIKAAHNNGLDVPKDIAICGMDDSMISKYTIPSLTTLKFSPFKLGAQAAKMILNRLENGGEPKEMILPVNVAKRNSITKEHDLSEDPFDYSKGEEK
ncbi:LacI family DNA-binding transcriptional regulator [Clostridia bacterium]|nr:LacI family DNA-binding transcriptional regulator [Clostridia bacterium]